MRTRVGVVSIFPPFLFVLFIPHTDSRPKGRGGRRRREDPGSSRALGPGNVHPEIRTHPGDPPRPGVRNELVNCAATSSTIG